MKPDIHPEYTEATITCACGASFVTRSTASSYTVDICSQCHPFYTGKQRMVDTAGRVEKFRRKFEKAQKLQKDIAGRKAAKEGAAAPAEAAPAEAASAEAAPAEAAPAEAAPAEAAPAEATPEAPAGDAS